MSRSRLRAARSGSARPGTRPAGAVLCILAALGAGGCQTTHRSTQDWVMRAVGAPMAPVVAAVQPKPEMEADGIEVQAPPRLRQRREPDDPTEPFSPNYGSVPPRVPVGSPEQVYAPGAAPAVAPAAPPALPADLPPQFRRRIAAAMAR